VLPTPLVPGGGAHSLGGEGVGASQFQRVDRHCGNLGMYVPFAIVLSYAVQIPVHQLAEDPEQFFADPDPCSQVGNENPDPAFRLEMRIRSLLPG
jgi:hypothetical protein